MFRATRGHPIGRRGGNSWGIPVSPSGTSNTKNSNQTRLGSKFTAGVDGGGLNSSSYISETGVASYRIDGSEDAGSVKTLGFVQFQAHVVPNFYVIPESKIPPIRAYLCYDVPRM
jgi:hypothetical protein